MTAFTTVRTVGAALPADVLAATVSDAQLKGLTADLLGRLKNDGIRLLRLPSIVELSQHDGVTLLPMRDINIEELLAREPIELDRRAVGGLIQGRRVLITGAGGSIGAELCRQCCRGDTGNIRLCGQRG